MRFRILAALAALASAVLVAPPASATPVIAASSAAALDTTFNGEGDDLIRIKATKNRGIIVASHDGDSNFIVYGLDRRGKKSQVLFNAIGSYSGTALYNLTPGTELAALQVETDGLWTMKLRPLSSAPLWKGATTRGTGDAVLRLNPPSRGLRTVRARYAGDSNFIVYSLTGASYPDVLFNEINDYSGKTSLPSGTRVVIVQTKGKWIMTRK